MGSPKFNVLSEQACVRYKNFHYIGLVNNFFPTFEKIFLEFSSSFEQIFKKSNVNDNDRRLSADYRIDVRIPLHYVYGKILTRDVIIVILRLHYISDNIFP